MRRRITIELDVSRRDFDRNIMDKIAYLALKTIRSSGGNLVSIKEEEVQAVITSLVGVIDLIDVAHR